MFEIDMDRIEEHATLCGGNQGVGTWGVLQHFLDAVYESLKELKDHALKEEEKHETNNHLKAVSSPQEAC